MHLLTAQACSYRCSNSSGHGGHSTTAGTHQTQGRHTLQFVREGGTPLTEVALPLLGEESRMGKIGSAAHTVSWDSEERIV